MMKTATYFGRNLLFSDNKACLVWIRWIDGCKGVSWTNAARTYCVLYDCAMSCLSSLVQYMGWNWVAAITASDGTGVTWK